MSRKLYLPDINDRSPNTPSELMSSSLVLALYNQENKGAEEGRFNNTVENYITALADNAGWKDIKWLGGQCLLTANVQVLRENETVTSTTLT